MCGRSSLGRVCSVAGGRRPAADLTRSARQCTSRLLASLPLVQAAVVAYVPRGHREGARAPAGPDGRTQKQRMLAGRLPCLRSVATTTPSKLQRSL